MVTRDKIAYLICFLFFVAYSILSVIRHQHFGSYGFDLGIADQTIWQYSQFKLPITTIDHVVFVPELFVHLEFIYILLAPFYWIFNNVNTLLLLQALAISFSGFAIFLLAQKHKLNTFLSSALLVSYLMFYGIQNAVWFDAHSTVFGASFLAWFIYFLDSNRFRLSLLALFLTIICKENYAAMTLSISLVYFFLKRDKKLLLFTGLSALYLLLAFAIYFPLIGGYRFQSKQGFLGGISIFEFFNTQEKRQVIFYTLASTGFLSLLQPLFLIPLIGNLASYFILGRDVTTAQGLILQYRVELAPLLFWTTIYGIKRIKKLNSKWTGVFLLVISLLIQYHLHLPLSYLSKRWFWQEPASVKDINKIITFLPANTSIVSQNNITPHLSHREQIFTLYPVSKDFVTNSPCGKKTCSWFTWVGIPQYLIVSTSADWDERGFFINREDFIKGLQNMEKAGVVTKLNHSGDTFLYRVNHRP